MPVLHIARGLPSCRPSSSLVVNFQPIGANFRQKVAKVNNFLGVLGVFSGKSETKKGKSEIYFGFGAFVVLLSSSFVVAVVVSTGPEVGRLSMLQDLPEVGSGPLVVCSMPFVRLSALPYCFAFQICPYFAF